MNKKIRVIFTTVLILVFVCIPVFGQEKDASVKEARNIEAVSSYMYEEYEFYNDHGNWYCVDRYGDIQTGWVYCYDNWYFFDYNYGIMQTGWINDYGDWYYFYNNGTLATNTTIDACYVDQYGVYQEVAVQTGWIFENGQWLYMDEVGMPYYGWLYDYGDYYYFDDGIMHIGWLNDYGDWYYFYNDGTLATNTTIDGCYVDEYGAYQEYDVETGWVYDYNYCVWNYFYSDGSMAIDTVIDGCYIDIYGNYYEE
ncbi:hypothetical protein SH2C18_21950 [Clostridium sediminicola]|uniref:hypothetical protein n=1 Tax=Clostridium sediminicola TaxID=3114879 RepID=UPI0031F1E96D